MESSVVSTSCTRSAETMARGTIMKIIAIIRNDMMICIVYWIYAIMSPTCMVDSAMACPPTHMMSSVTRFMMSIMIGIVMLITRWVKRFVRVRSSFALSKRASSNFSFVNARTTSMPLKFSRLTRFNLSVKRCKLLNFGIATFKSTTTRHSSTMTASAMIQLSETLFCSAKIMPPTPMIGA